MAALATSARPLRTRHGHRSGRPPAGVRKGERVRDYPQTSLRLPPEMKAKLYALSRVAGTPQWRLVSEALDCFFHDRTRAEQRQVISYLARKRRR
ncbi:MAG: hypothetical protein JWL71_3225 [Acidobacteria bacterium]|nr:hypothetical protein [Acidobacteriota bacterium]